MKQARSLIVGIACGIACVVGLLLYTNEVQAAVAAEKAEALSRYGATQVEVYVASRDIAAGSKADSSNVERKTMPSELLPEGSVTELSQIEGASAQSEVYKGEVLVAKRFEEVSGVSINVPDGMCAVSVPAKAVSAVGGSVSPGAEVNVYSTTASSTDLLAANVCVLSTSASASSSSSKKETSTDVSWITLAVKPALVSELIAAAGTSDLYFTLPSESLTENDIRQAQKVQGTESASSSTEEKKASSDGAAASGIAESAEESSSSTVGKEGK